jgi:hypothetical protein
MIAYKIGETVLKVTRRYGKEIPSWVMVTKDLLASYSNQSRFIEQFTLLTGKEASDRWERHLEWRKYWSDAGVMQGVVEW